MKKNNIKIVSILVVAFFCAGCQFFREKIPVKIGSKIYHLEVAHSPSLQKKGLSGRKKLQADQGMLFVFKKEGRRSFWMKDTHFPLQMIFLDQNKKIREIFLAPLCSDDFCEIYFFDNTKYVIEVLGSEKLTVKKGDQILFEL